VVGVALGLAGAALVQKLAGPLTASLGASTGSATPGGAQTAGGGRFPAGGGPGGFRQAAADTVHNVAVHLTAPVTLGAVILAVVLAIAGGLIAGSFGGWRAARLRPAAALSRVE
jgi:ABC-type lipoprotein release transport system permease subunit